jgi:hypothetical protein
MVRDSIAHPDPESGMGKKSGSGSGMNNPDHISESFEKVFWFTIHKFFDADPGWKKFGSVIRDKHPGYATLVRDVSWIWIFFPS